ncbi:MAG: Lipoprotein signal peptidase [Pseudomonadota bacterium]|jgi:signal peptidase II|nr:signal peptidase II [Betaproteobacteria bacterium]
MARSSHRSLVLWLGMAAAILLFDQFTKLLVISRFELGDSQAVTSYFNLVRVHNSGAAFSFLSTASGWQRWLFTGIGVAAAGFMVWLLRSHPQQTLFCFALSLVLGGAVGNVVDRMLWGHVIDFLDFHGDWLSPVFYQGHFPAFNVADSAISVGAVCLIADELIRVRRTRA